MKKLYKDTLVIGFALFSMLFGAGNLIFPPYLGLEGGSAWFTGFICYFIADVGLALLALLAILKCGGSKKLTSGLGRKSSTALLCIITLCIGPLVAVPRTAATTYELSIKPLTSHIPAFAFSIAFFLLIFILCIKESAVVDIVGKILTPGLLIGLLILIVKGILSPIGEISDVPLVSHVADKGIQAGYQTLDVLALIVFGVIILKTADEKGYHTQKEQTKIVTSSGMIACIGLFLTYIGLAYLGATAFSIFRTEINRSTLIISIVKNILGQPGLVIFSVVVALACITTALALVSSSAEFFTELFHEKISYKYFVAMICIISALLSIVGLDAIILVASPVLDIIYPPVLTLILLTLLWRKNQPFKLVLHAAVTSAFIMSILITADNLWGLLPMIQHLPFYSIGFAWVLPMLICTGICILLETWQQSGRR